jgi:hypothetical protein
MPRQQAQQLGARVAGAADDSDFDHDSRGPATKERR